MLRDLRAWLWRRRGWQTLWGDGSHDDAPAVQTLLDGGSVRRPDSEVLSALPEGRFRIGTPLRIWRKDADAFFKREER